MEDDRDRYFTGGILMDFKPRGVLRSHEVPNKPDYYGKEFHGCISREEAANILSASDDGSFLVRESKSYLGGYVLTVRFDGVSRHIRLYYDGMHSFDSRRRFKTIQDLVTQALEDLRRDARAKKEQNPVRSCISFQESKSRTIDVKQQAESDNVSQDAYEMQRKSAPKPRRILCSKKIPNRPEHYGNEFHGCISRQEAEDLVSQCDGSYIVRESQRVPGTYSLTLRFGGVCKHFKLFYDGMHYVGDKRFKTLDDLVTDGLIRMTLDAKDKEQTPCSSSNINQEFTSRTSDTIEDKQHISDEQNCDGKAPLEILARGPLALQAYQKALIQGKTCVKRVPIMLIGQFQSGKTSLKKSLRGEPFDPDEKNTIGVEMDPSYFQLSVEAWTVEEKNQATDPRPALISFEEHAAKFIFNTITEERKSTETSHLESGNSTFNDAGSPVPDQEECPREVFESSSADDNLFDVPEMPQDVAVLIEKLLQGVEDGKDEEEIYATLWDFGGQSVYYTTHPLFFTSAAIYFLVYNLSRNPDDKADPQVKKGFFSKIRDVFCERSHRAYLDLWMSSVSSLVSEDEDHKETLEPGMLQVKPPPVFLVCTHADKPYNSTDPEELAREIYGSLQTKIHGKHLYDVFVVDNTKSGNESVCSGVTRLRKEVLAVAKKLPKMKEAIPIKWLKYEKALHVLVKKGHKWIDLKQAKEIAREACKIYNDEEFLALLNFLHDQRTLIHFDDKPELNDIVILDLKWLIDVFKRVIAIKPYEKEENKFTQLWLKLEKTGILEEELLKHVWDPIFEKDQETYNSLIAMMEKFCLLCPWTASFESKPTSQYLVPSMLLFPPKEDTMQLIASAGIPSLYVKFTSGHVPHGLFPRLVLMVFQWCDREFLCQSYPQLHHNFARFHTHPAEGCSIILLCHSSFIEVVVHKDSSAIAVTTEASTNVLSKLNSTSECRFDIFQMKIARTLCTQLGLMLLCMRKEFPWLKNMQYEMSVCCPVCCQNGSVSYCLIHNVCGCKQEECLHFWSECQLRDFGEAVICTKSSFAGDCRVPVQLFKHWFSFLDKKPTVDVCAKRCLPCKEEEDEKAIVLLSGALEALQLQACDPSVVVARLQENLSLDQSSLEKPNPETKRLIRCLCTKAIHAKRIDVVKELRGIVPAGTTGPLLHGARDVLDISFETMQNLTINLSGGDEWKSFAERLGLSPAEIRYVDKRVMNPCEAVVLHSRKQGYITSVGELYDALVDCKAPVLADLL